MKALNLLCLTAVFAPLVFAGEPPANSTLVVDESFDGSTLGEGWHVNTGEWKVVEGVLKAREIAEDKHSAAARRTVMTGNAVYELKFRLTGEGKGFHFGFDPAPGELDKKGHLFSVMVSPTDWKVMKHVDKAKPKEDPNEILAQQKTEFVPGEWYSLRVTTWGPYVTAAIDGKETFKVSHPTFGVKKPTLVFRCLGDGIDVDDIKVWTANE